MAISCTHQSLFYASMAAADKCRLISEACDSTQEVINFYRLYYCHIPHPWIIALIVLTAIFVIFTFTCETVEDYIAPAIVKIVKTLKMSDALAGVTLLALANGIGDVITALVASGTENAVSYNVGAIFGAGLFVMTVVVFFTIKNSEIQIQITRSMIFRDIGIYIIATLFTIYCATEGYITLTDSCVFLILYLILVLVVVIANRLPANQKSQQEIDVIARTSKAALEDDDEEFQRLAPTLDPQQLQLFEIIRRSSFRRILYSLQDTLIQRKEIREDYLADKAITLEKLSGILNYPFLWLKRLTIPPCNEEHYHKKYLILWPYLGIPFVLWALFREPHLWWVFYLPIAVGLSIAFYFTSPADPHEPPRYFFFICVVGVIVGILWTKTICEALIDTLNFTGVMANMSTTYLGLTVIAIGNALPDAITTVALAKNGQAILGLTGGYVGQIFGLLVGFGISMLKKNLIDGKPVVFDLFNEEKLMENLLEIVVLFTALIVMVITFVWNIKTGYKFTKPFGYTMLAIYLVFFIFATTFAVVNAIKTF